MGGATSTAAISCEMKEAGVMMMRLMMGAVRSQGNWFWVNVEKHDVVAPAEEVDVAEVKPELKSEVKTEVKLKVKPEDYEEDVKVPVKSEDKASAPQRKRRR